MLTIVLFFLGHVTLTGAELFLSAASWTFEAELMDPRRRGEYQGAAELSGTLGRVWAPAVYTLPRDGRGAPSAGWSSPRSSPPAAAGLHPSAALARRFLEQHVPADVLADARRRRSRRARPSGAADGRAARGAWRRKPARLLPESLGDLPR